MSPTTRASCGRCCAPRSTSRAEGSLPVNVRFCCDGEEEIGGTSIVGFLDQHAGEAAACVIFDAGMLDAETPVFYISARGTLYLHVEVTAAQRDLHSGVFGGAALNALHVLIAALNRVLLVDGRLPEPLLTGLNAVGDDEAARLEWAPRRRVGPRSAGRSPGRPVGRGRVLPPYLGAPLDRRQRDRRRLAVPAEDDRRLESARQPLDAARPWTDGRADHADHRRVAAKDLPEGCELDVAVSRPATPAPRLLTLA